MPSSFKILRGLDVQKRKIYYPPLKEENFQEPAAQGNPPPASPGAGKEGRVKEEAASVKEAKEEAKEILAGVREESEKLRREILAEAVTEARLIGEKARQEGYQEGYRQGEKAAQDLVEEARQTLERAGKERKGILAEAEPEIIRLAVSIAEKLLDYTMNIDSRCILSLIARGLHALPAGGKIFIKVNPQDEKICRENFYGLQELVKEGTLLEIVADEKIPPGNCRLESEEMEVEIFLQKELQLLGKKLLELAVSSGQQYLAEADFGETDWGTADD